MLFISVVAKRKKPSKELLHHFTEKNVLLQDALGYSRICFEHFRRYNYMYHAGCNFFFFLACYGILCRISFRYFGR